MLLLPRRKLLKVGAGLIAAPFVLRRTIAQVPVTGAGAGAPASSGFNPTSLITGAGGFWRADMGVTQTSGAVTAWADQSSFATNLSGSGLAYSATGFQSSKPGVTLPDGQFENLQTTLSFSSATASVFALINTNNPTFNRLTGVIANGGSDGTSPSFFLYANSSIFGLFCGGNQGQGGSAVSVSANTSYLIGGVFDGSDGNEWLNGAVQGSGSPFSTTLGGGAGATLYLGSSLTVQSGGATVAFFGLSQKAMNSTDWTNLKNWSNSNWGTSF